MNEQFKPENINSQEKSADQIYNEFNQAYDEVIKLMDQVHELEMKAGENDLSKEKFDSIVDERNKLAAQFDKKWETVKQLQEQWREAEEKEWKKSSKSPE